MKSGYFRIYKRENIFRYLTGIRFCQLRADGGWSQRSESILFCKIIRAATVGCIWCLWLLVSSQAFAQSYSEIVQEYRDGCSAEGGELEVVDGAVTYEDLTGDGSDDMIVSASYFQCSTVPYFRCGTGGCDLYLIADSVTQRFLARSWSIAGNSDVPVILLSVHGSLCGGVGADECIQAVTWSYDQFVAIEK